MSTLQVNHGHVVARISTGATCSTVEWHMMSHYLVAACKGEIRLYDIRQLNAPVGTTMGDGTPFHSLHMPATGSAIVCATLLGAYSLECAPCSWNNLDSPTCERLTFRTPAFGSCESLAASPGTEAVIVASFRQPMSTSQASQTVAPWHSRPHHQILRDLRATEQAPSQSSYSRNWGITSVISDHTSQSTMTRCGILPVKCPWRTAHQQQTGHVLFGADEVSGCMWLWDAESGARLHQVPARTNGGPVKHVLPRGLSASTTSWFDDWLVAVSRHDLPAHKSSVEVYYMSPKRS